MEEQAGKQEEIQMHQEIHRQRALKATLNSYRADENVELRS